TRDTDRAAARTGLRVRAERVGLIAIDVDHYRFEYDAIGFDDRVLADGGIVGNVRNIHRHRDTDADRRAAAARAAATGASPAAGRGYGCARVCRCLRIDVS